MAFDYAAATKACAAYNEEVGRFEREAAAYRDQASRAASPREKQSYLEAAKTLDRQVEQVRKLAEDMQRQMIDARGRERTLSFEEKLAEARERGKNRGRGDEGLEI